MSHVLLHSRKDEFVHDQSENDDDDHHAHDLADVCEVAPPHQHLAEAFCGCQHFARHERSPSKGPRLFQTHDDVRHCSGDDHGSVQFVTTCAHRPCRPYVQRVHILDARFDGHGDGKGGTDGDDKSYGVFIQSKPQYGKREPTNARQSLKPKHQWAEVFVEKLERHHENADEYAYNNRGGVPDQDTLHAGGDRNREDVVLDEFNQTSEHKNR